MCDKAGSSVSDEVILEVTQKLTVRGDYSSIVEGKDIEDAIAHYYKTSQQVEAHCAVLTFGKTYCCLLVEQFPITCEAEESLSPCGGQRMGTFTAVHNRDGINRRNT